MPVTINGTTGITSPQVDSPQINGGNIVGQVAFFAMATAPAGFLACSGQAISRTTYADLFAALGTLYGAGDGSTTFNLPDLRGEFIRGLDNGRGVDAARGLGTTQAAQNASHTHAFATGWGDGNGFAVSNGVIARSVDTTNRFGNYTTTSDGGTEARPRNVALLACIKF